MKKNQINRRQALTLLGMMGSLTALGSSPLDNGKHLHQENKKIKMKTIGILGGIGPQATMALEAQLHRASQKLVAPFYNTGYPPMVVCYHRDAPFVLNGDQPVFPLQPNPDLLDCARGLGTMADFIIIASNGAHMVQNEIERASGRKVLSMIDVTLDRVKKRNWRRVGVLAFKNSLVYTTRLTPMGITSEAIDGDLQKRLDTAIFKTMEGRDRAEDHDAAREAIRALRDKGVDGIITGCTEIPLLLPGDDLAPDLLNPSLLLAEAAIQYAISES